MRTALPRNNTRWCTPVSAVYTQRVRAYPGVFNTVTRSTTAVQQVGFPVLVYPLLIGTDFPFHSSPPPLNPTLFPPCAYDVKINLFLYAIRSHCRSSFAGSVPNSLVQWFSAFSDSCHPYPRESNTVSLYRQYIKQFMAVDFVEEKNE